LPQFNLPFSLRLQGPLDVRALEQSIAEVVRRHESLRSGFAWLNGQPVAGVVPATDIGSVLDVEDARRRTAEEPAAKALQLKRAKLLAEQEAWTPFDVARAPLLRARLLRLGKNDHVLLMTVHHAIVDGWSIGILFEEISKLYSAVVDGRQESLLAVDGLLAGGASAALVVHDRVGGPATRLLEEEPAWSFADLPRRPRWRACASGLIQRL
jgi:hypothetical protein